MATPDELRERANAAEVAGDETLAESLRNEADDLENPTPEDTTGAAP